MDYQEAIETIQYASAFNSENSRLTKALDVAISAMQELQALHDQGISLERLKDIDFRKDVVEHINYDAYMSLTDELERYKQIGTLDEVRYAIQELQELRSTDDNLYDHIEELKQAKYDIETFWEEPTTLSKAIQIAISALYEIKSYKQLGTLEEVREAVGKQNAKKPIYKHYEDIGEPPHIKIACPNGCGIQLYPVTDKHLAHEHAYCPKCGQAIDWSEDNG